MVSSVKLTVMFFIEQKKVAIMRLYQGPENQKTFNFTERPYQGPENQKTINATVRPYQGLETQKINTTRQYQGLEERRKPNKLSGYQGSEKRWR